MPSKLKCIPGYPGYYVCREGHVYSSWRGPIVRLKPKVRSWDGYIEYGLKVGEKQVFRKAHFLVALVFIGPRPEGQEVMHLNHDKTDNRPENLAYGTRQKNVDDKVAAKRHAHGSKQGHAKLTEDDVREIRRSTENNKTLGSKYRMLARSIGAVRRGIGWKHVS